MLKKIRVVPLAAESLGVRSMCTYVETADIRVLLDAGVSLCPNRFGLPPHPKEFNAIDECRRHISEAARRADVTTISHYHFDHHTPSFEDWLCNWTMRSETARKIYGGKMVLAKNAREMINYSQRRRGWMFERTGGKYARKLEYADGRTYIHQDTIVRFSEPVPHGPYNSPLGWVLMTTIEYEGERFMFAPDVQGPMSVRTLEIINAEKPQLLIIGGPPSYLSQDKVSAEQIQTGLKNLESLIEHVPIVILEHHVLRDGEWRERVTGVAVKAHDVGHMILTAAEFLRKENLFLEAERRRLYAEDPPSKEFEAWMRKNDEEKKHARPLV
jgi:predicted metallo-beta-lactamase superfamily hydrolase